MPVQADEPSLAAHQGGEPRASNLKLTELLFRGQPEVVDADLADYFGSIPHTDLLKSVARRIVLASLNLACRDQIPTFPQRSPPSLLTTAACGGLRPAPDCRSRRALLHLSYSSAPQYSDGAFVTHAPIAELRKPDPCEPYLSGGPVLAGMQFRSAGRPSRNGRNDQRLPGTVGNSRKAVGATSPSPASHGAETRAGDGVTSDRGAHPTLFGRPGPRGGFRSF